MLRPRACRSRALLVQQRYGVPRTRMASGLLDGSCPFFCLTYTPLSWMAGWGASDGQGKRRLSGVTAAHAAAAAQSNAIWLEDCVIRLMCVLALDRFGDFVGDQVKLSYWNASGNVTVCRARLARKYSVRRGTRGVLA